MTEGLTRAAVYERELPVSTERVWENVHDWEHLPYLHSTAFCGIALDEAGPWGWRARVQVPPREAPSELLIELRLEGDTGRYHTRTLEGPGTGADTITTVTSRGEHASAVRVEFWVPEPDADRAAAIGRGMVALYTQLWDEDERMMVERQAFLDRRGRPRSPGAEPVDLGPVAALAGTSPVVETSRGPMRVAEADGQWRAVSAVCPHLGGPLDEAPVEDGHLICPWHGYRFSLVNGRNPDGRPCRLPTPIALEPDEDGHLRIPAS